ncbi:ATP-binding protein [Solimonas sp. C16B3]|uniref:ATP-binding protein n=1 Tax=Solimonas marina TaxID=2714601 RepID=A0A969WCP1_9GAMM|nr:ATP-binding protein [Solimonas marina]
MTDGIYRQPSSALRELISNAYDADATEVFIETDVPRFSQIRIRDNGAGMDEQMLARLVYHIGGSSKRTRFGKALGTTSAESPELTPKGRRLIGKIGIGLFSVSQLTSHFQIITKMKGASHRLIADVILRTYSEDIDESGDVPFESGSVKVFSVPAEDEEVQGTEIILLSVRPRARDILRSKDRWLRWAEEEVLLPEKRDPKASPPSWHVGFLLQESKEGAVDATYQYAPKIPWDGGDAPLSRFRKLFAAVADQVGTTTERPDLAGTLDTYLAALWSLSLSAPLDYIDKHPFDLTGKDDVLLYKLRNSGRGKADPVQLGENQTIREALSLSSGAADPAGGFRVFVDQVELRRPIKFAYWPQKRTSVGKAMMFVGAYRPDLSKVAAHVRGGTLEFEGYLFLNSKVVPKENNGVLIRINGSSGALFDDQFMKYQISEQTRLRQITSEIFVSSGLDAALNIDRESFNFAHPHYQILSNWLHLSLRQLANTHKALGDAVRQALTTQERARTAQKLEQFAQESWMRARREDLEPPPEVQVTDKPLEAEFLRKAGAIVYEKALVPMLIRSERETKLSADDRSRREQVLKAIATVLDGYGVLSDMPYAKQHELLDALLVIYFENNLK